MYFYFKVKTHVDKINAKQKIIKTLVCTVKKTKPKVTSSLSFEKV